MKPTHLSAIGWVLLLLACGSNGGTVTTTVLADRLPIVASCTDTTCRVTWYFHAVGPVAQIIATVSVAGSTFLHTDTLPGTATQDTATVPVLPGGSGLACARAITAAAASASCKPWNAPGTVITDSVVVGINVWVPPAMPASVDTGAHPIARRYQWCLFCNRPTSADGSVILARTAKRPAIRWADRVMGQRTRVPVI